MRSGHPIPTDGNRRRAVCISRLMRTVITACLITLIASCDDADPSTAPDTLVPDTSVPEPDTSVPEPDAASACPTPPFGTALGDTLADYTLYACDGTPTPLSQACDAPVTFINAFAGWCPPCRTHAEEAPADHAALLAAAPDARWLFVITEDQSGQRPTLAYCDAIREAYQLPMTVLVDRDGAFPAHLGVSSPNSWYLVLSPGLRLEAKIKYAKNDALGVALDLAE